MTNKKLIYLFLCVTNFFTAEGKNNSSIKTKSSSVKTKSLKKPVKKKLIKKKERKITNLERKKALALLTQALLKKNIKLNNLHNLKPSYINNLLTLIREGFNNFYKEFNAAIKREEAKKREILLRKRQQQQRELQLKKEEEEKKRIENLKNLKEQKDAVESQNQKMKKQISSTNQKLNIVKNKNEHFKKLILVLIITSLISLLYFSLLMNGIILDIIPILITIIIFLILVYGIVDSSMKKKIVPLVISLILAFGVGNILPMLHKFIDTDLTQSTYENIYGDNIWEILPFQKIFIKNLIEVI